MGTEPFVAQIQIFACNFAPRGWATCNGQLLPISQNTALFSLLGTNYGGDGKSTFGLPNLQGQAPVSQGQGQGLSQYFVGESVGTASVTLLQMEIPQHLHNVNCYNDSGAQNGPGGNILATSGADSRGNVVYVDGTAGSTLLMNPTQIQLTGGSQPHNNMSPYLTLNYCIALQGVFPARN